MRIIAFRSISCPSAEAAENATKNNKGNRKLSADRLIASPPQYQWTTKM